MSSTPQPSSHQPSAPSAALHAASAPHHLDSADRPRITGAVGVAEVQASVLDRTGLSRVDYVDHFTLAPLMTGSPAPTAEQWARALFGDVPSLSERCIWQGFLQLRLANGRSPFTVAGWRIAEIGQDWIRLETESWALRASLVVRATGESVSLTTALQYDRPVGSYVWLPLSAVHRRLVPSLFRPAVAELAARPGNSDPSEWSPDRSGA